MYLGVDGGGTKTAFALIDKNGELIAEHEERTCYHIEVGIDGAKTVIENGVNTILSKVDKSVNDITFAFLGLPAYGEDSSLIDAIDSIPSIVLPNKKYQCGNDMISGWAAAFECNDGINIVSGTGSIAYGERKGVAARCGGWGELFSDEGSAYWIGCKGLNAFTKMSDGRLAKGYLYEHIKSSLDFQTDFDLSAIVLSAWNGDRGKVAKISALVSSAALEGDSESQKIFTQAGQELALIIDTVRKKLHYTQEEVINVSYSGGVFNSEQLILSPLTTALRRFSPHYNIQTPRFSPVIGAAQYARAISNKI